MASHGHIHVIDPDFRRRARITFELAQRNLHAEIYEDLDEFESRCPSREHEVLELMVEGDSNKEIGRRLGISPRTVEIHRGNMMRKLNARSPSDAVRLAMYAGLDAATEDERIAA